MSFDNTKLKATRIYESKKASVYELPGFQPKIIDEKYLKDLGISQKIDLRTHEKLRNGSKSFLERWNKKSLYPDYEISLQKYDLNKAQLLQKYTGVCPRNVIRLDPAYGCLFGCFYCLDLENSFDRRIIAYKNYDDYVKKSLWKNEGHNIYYYLSAVTDLFQESLLETGIIHRVLKVFSDYYNRFPDSTQRLFIATKAGPRHLLFPFQGFSVLELLKSIPSSKLKFNTSIGIIPTYLIEILEPNAASVDERLAMVEMCINEGMDANNILIQPIFLPYAQPEILDNYLNRLNVSGIKNIKPECVTISLESLAILGEIIGYFDKMKEKEMYEMYIFDNNIKGSSGRLAPNRKLYHNIILSLYKIGNKYDMTMSICNWIRTEMNISKEDVPILENNKMFPCL